MVAFYNQGDQDIYKTDKFMPQSRYLLNAPTPVQGGGQDASTPSFGIPNTNAFNNSGNDGFSVYNPDPNSLPSYRPNYDYRQFSEYDSDPSTTDIKQMDMNQEYFNAPPPSKLQGLMGMLPGIGTFARGVNFLGNQIGPYIPPNRRAIMENELAGKGVMVNDIGQIVQGSGAYDDISGRNVMAGYNPYKMTAKTFDDRIAMAKDKMNDKGKYKQPRLDALKAAKADFLKTQKKADKIFDFEEEERKELRKKTILGKFMADKKQKKADKIVAAADETSVANYPTGRSYDTNTTGQASSNQYGTYTPSVTPQQAQDNQDRGRGQQDTESRTNSQQGPAYDYAKGGRVGYFFGGRVNFKDGGLASIL